MLLPALQRARQQARQTVCASQLKQLGLLMPLYANDNGGTLPQFGERYYGEDGTPMMGGNQQWEHGFLFYLRTTPSRDPNGTGVYPDSSAVGWPNLYRCPTQTEDYPFGASPSAAWLKQINAIYARPELLGIWIADWGGYGSNPGCFQPWLRWFGGNPEWWHKARLNVRRPTETCAIGDGNYWYIWAASGMYYRHLDGKNYVYFDGHAAHLNRVSEPGPAELFWRGDNF